MSRFLTLYCDAPHCAGKHRNSAELELPEHLEDIGDSVSELEQWIAGNMESLGWTESAGEARCPECVAKDDAAEFLRVCPALISDPGVRRP